MTDEKAILVLDNDPPRHAAFRAAVPEFTVLETYAVSSFEYAMQVTGSLDLICLDHDLQSGVNADRHCEDCGCDAAELIANRGPPGVPVLIHSGNTPCAQVMRRILVASGRVGRVSRVNIATIMEHGDRGGIATLRQDILQLIESPYWPDDVSTSELLDLLGDSPELTCPVRASRR